MFKHIYILLISFVIFLIASSCGKRTEIPTAETRMRVVVTDQEERLISANATAYLFTNLNAFNNAKDGDYTGAIQTLEVNEGEVSFRNLENRIYYVLVYYNDGVIEMNNYFSQYALLNPLEKGAITTVRITLSPFNVGSLILWADNTNLQNIAIEVFFGDDPISIGTINSIRTTAPTNELDTEGAVTVLYREPGTYKWYAKGENGCYWEGTVSFVPGRNDVHVVKIEDCVNGTLTFWTKPVNLPNFGAISIYMLNGDYIGELSEGLNNAPTNCASSSAISVSRPIGEYSWYAENDNCHWQGTISITDAECKTVEILPCD